MRRTRPVRFTGGLGQPSTPRRLVAQSPDASPLRGSPLFKAQGSCLAAPHVAHLPGTSDRPCPLTVRLTVGGPLEPPSEQNRYHGPEKC